MNLTTRRLGAATLAAAVLLTMMWYVGLYRPESARTAKAHKEYAAAQAKSQQLQVEAATLRALLRQVPADQAKLAALSASVPTTPDLKDVLLELHQLATATNVQLTSVSPAVPASASGGSSSAASTASGGAHAITMPMVASGSYPALMTFMKDLASMPRTLVVDGLSLGSAQGGMAATLSTRIFYSS